MELRLVRGASLSLQWVSQRFVVGYERRMDSSFFYVFGNFKFGLAILNVAGDKPTRAFESWLFRL